MSMAKTKENRLIKSETGRNPFLLKSNIVLLFALAMMIFVVPLFEIKENYLTRVLLVVVVASGLFAADFSRASYRILRTIGSVVILVTLMNLIWTDSRSLGGITFLLNTLFFIIVTIALIAHVAKAERVYKSTLLCAINSYLLIGFSLSLLFIILDLFVPGSFSEMDAAVGGYPTFVYYGFVTLTTLGYGDITPDSALARSLSTFTALFGQLYLVIIMALIIGKYLKGDRSGK